MADDDRPGRIRRDLHQVLTDVHDIANRLATMTPDQVHLPARQPGPRGSGPANPTQAVAVARETVLAGHAVAYACLLTGSVTRTVEGLWPLAWDLGCDVPPPASFDPAIYGGPHPEEAGFADLKAVDRDVANIIDDLIGGMPTSPPWRTALHRCCDRLTVLTGQLVDRTHELHGDRWITTARGDVLDEHADQAYTMVAARITATARDVRRVAGRLADVPIRTCACGCGKPAPPVGQGATRGACRQRAYDRRRRDAS